MKYNLIRYYTQLHYECYPSYALEHCGVMVSISSNEYDDMNNCDDSERKEIFEQKLRDSKYCE